MRELAYFRAPMVDMSSCLRPVDFTTAPPSSSVCSAFCRYCLSLDGCCIVRVFLSFLLLCLNVSWDNDQIFARAPHGEKVICLCFYRRLCVYWCYFFVVVVAMITMPGGDDDSPQNSS